MRYIRLLCLFSCAQLFFFGCNSSNKCSPGSLQCGCKDDGSCVQPATGAAICVDKTCKSCTPGAPGCAPAAQPCYSPCTADLATTDGGTIACSVEGLLAGCLGNNACNHGSCVAPGSPLPGCHANGDCADFQTCVGGLCYSTCQVDADCGQGLGCFRKVCHPTCTTSSPTCPAGTACTTVDGTNGYCKDVQPGDGQSATRVGGSFTVSKPSIEFSNVTLQGTFTITNNGPTAQEFIVRKVKHTEFHSDGTTTLVTTNPLSWLTLGQVPNALAPAQQLTVELDGNGATATIAIGGAANPTLNRWEGQLEVSSLALGTHPIDLSYISQPDGQWQGKMEYFANFPSAGLDAWVQDRSNPALLLNVGNAFIQRWAAYRAGQITLDEMEAVMQATVTGSWQWPSLRSYCPDPNTACYLYDNPQGYSTYSSSLTQYPIPTGVSELPISMNVEADPSSAGLGLSGKIVTAQSLHYPGDPGISITFTTPTTACATHGLDVVCDISALQATALVGGRYVTDQTDTSCKRAPTDAMGNATFTLTKTPWLVPGFKNGTDVDPTTMRPYRYECRDNLLPTASQGALNNSFAAANPIPDGRTRQRKLELVDGALINSQNLVILFKETFPSFLDPNDSTGFSAYGFMVLTRTPASLDASAYTSGTTPDMRTPPTGVLGVACSPDVLMEATGSSTMPTGSGLDSLAQTLITGIQASNNPPTPIQPTDAIKVHYYCEDTGLFDGGKNDDGSPSATKVPCPAGSRVQYFTVVGLTQADIAHLACQQGFQAGTLPGQIVTRGTCQDTLTNQWLPTAANSLTLDPVWVCQNPAQFYCSLDRYDLRSGKNFFPPATASVVYLPLRTEVANAFRYKTRFVNRQGNSVGFAPEICIPDSDQVPYCYDPAAIEHAQSRVDCALALYTQHFAQLSAASQTTLQGYLTTDFSFDQEIDPTQPLPIIHEGYEWLNSELLVMMGDDSYTRTFTSRFDLSGQSVVSFDGPSFEPNGISLSGGAGFEMYNLYQAVQYYQQALDRFYALSPTLWASISTLGATNGFVSKDTIATYFERLIRASSQKSQAWSEIAKRYQSFNRPDLARLVVERSYTSAYLESIVLSRMMLALGNVLTPQDRPQLAAEVESAALVYRSALLQMRENYQAITDQPTLFGFAPDYIPFPALEPSDTDAFSKTFASAQSLMQVAATKEELALAANQSYNTDEAAFQSELVSIRNDYENQLAQICGTFTGSDGNIYPAIPKYAYLNDEAKLVGDPCGLAGNGQIYQAMSDVDLAVAAFQGVRVKHDNLVSSIQIEQQRVETQCELIQGTADYQYSAAEQVQHLQDTVDAAQAAMDKASRMVDKAGVLANLRKCINIAGTANGTDCPQAAFAASAYMAASREATVVDLIAEPAKLEAQHEIDTLNLETARWVTERQCDYATADSNAKVAQMMLGFKELEVEAYEADLDIQQKMAAVTGLRNQAQRIIAQQSQTEQLAINVEAAKDDPDVRIYKNDAIITAENTFDAAVQEAYKATKVFEYYTSQTYAHEGDLFLVRLVSHGDISLESYLFNLQQAFATFQEQYGLPDQRVLILSLRDDILQVPRLDTNGQPLTDAARLALFRQALTDPRHLDQNGYLTFPLTSGSAPVSPLTRDHKVLAVEAEIVGSDVGDDVGRLYLTQKGTGEVQPLSGTALYYLLPTRTAVINPFFNGHRVFGDAIYLNDHLRDRPLLNTHWELVLNQKDEQANQDINLHSLTDVRLYLTYTDFTAL